MGKKFAYAAETAFMSPTLIKIGQMLLEGIFSSYIRSVSVPHDPDLVPVPPGRVLPHPYPRQPVREVYIRKKKTLDYPTFHWGGPR